MIKTNAGTMMLVGVLLAALALPGCSKKKASTPSPAAGQSLLVRYADVLKAVAESGRVEREIITPQLEGLSSEAAALTERDELEPAFTLRYQRMVGVTRLLFVPASDPGAAAATRTIERFVKDIQGPGHTFDGGGGLAAIAPSISKEILDLHQVLDPSADRAALREKYLPGLVE